MADPVAAVERIMKIGLKIKEAVDKVHQNEEVCQEIRKCVHRSSAILLQQQQQTGLADSDPGMGGALQDLEATLQRALELVTACQVERGMLRRLVTAGDLAKQLRAVKDDISNKVMLASFAVAVSTHTSIILLTKQSGVHPPPRLPENTELMEVSLNRSIDDARSRQDGEENNILGGSQASFSPLVATLRKFRLSELKAATNTFSNVNAIGSGGSFIVYKGVLNNQNMIAIKKLRSEPRLGWAHTYNQLLLASKLQHRNVVKVLGYAHEDEDTSFMAWLKGRKGPNREMRYIWVEEYIPMGNLHEIIYSQEPRPDWSSLIRIIEGIAQGVYYLHEQRILHLDLKPANILLDCHMNPKITDFDLAKVLDDNNVDPDTSGVVPDLFEVMDNNKLTTNNTGVAGTLGYLAPEYVTNGTLSAKRDVYAFGITLLETIGCIRRKFNRSREHPIGRWAWEAWEDGQLEEEFDPEQFDEHQLMEIKRCIEVGLLCAQGYRADRPSMADVVAMLNGEKDLPTPKKPGYILREGRRSTSLPSLPGGPSHSPFSTVNPGHCSPYSGVRENNTKEVDLPGMQEDQHQSQQYPQKKHQSQQHDLLQELQRHREELKRWREKLKRREEDEDIKSLSTGSFHSPFSSIDNDLGDYRPPCNVLEDKTGDDDLLGMQDDKHQRQEHELQKRELQLQRRIAQLERHEEEVHTREVQLQRRLALLYRQEAQVEQKISLLDSIDFA